MTDNNNLPLVTVGFVNCNRLFYLQSCVESFLECTQDYPNKELIIIDNASVEAGTHEYLDEKEKQGFTVHRNMLRDPSNEFARALNTICQTAQGQFVMPLQGDMQFVVRGKWLREYINFYSKFGHSVGCMTLDAARLVTNASRNATVQLTENGYDFVWNNDSSPVIGAGDVMYSRQILEMILPWNTDNVNHEGGQDSETVMLQKCKHLIEQNRLSLRSVSPVLPPAVMIYTDARGTNARVRGNRRYGDYWPAKSDRSKYYEIFDYVDAQTISSRRANVVTSIEELARPIGWNAPLDHMGRWQKNPIRPESATPSDYVELVSEPKFIDLTSFSQKEKNVDDKDLDEWLNA